MADNFIINDSVLFIPDENKLCPISINGTEVIFDGPEITLNAPVSRILFLLLTCNGDVVSHEDIIWEVWGKLGQVVALNTLYQNVSLLRKSLKKANTESSSIRTHPKSGFSFRGKITVIKSRLPLEAEPDSLDDINVGKLKENSSIIANSSIKDIQDIAPATHEPNNSHLHKKTRKKAFLTTFLTIIFILITTFLLLFLKKYHGDKGFTDAHILLDHINHCPLYIDKVNKGNNFNKLISFLKDSKVTCAQNEFMYLTKNIYSREPAFYLCSEKKQGDLTCSVKATVPVHLLPK